MAVLGIDDVKTRLRQCSGKGLSMLVITIMLSEFQTTTLEKELDEEGN